jgi:murein DD-endopeptidase MepM/ murein hydrolase activator NlpD
MLAAGSAQAFYPFPVKYWKSSNFGEYRSPKYLHDGIDISVGKQKVFPVAPGYIDSYDDKGATEYGYWVMIDHGTFKTRYCHLKEISYLVKEKKASGERIETGEIIGVSGNTGYGGAGAWPYHLHFESLTTSGGRSEERRVGKECTG